jgi:pimeloyl-ACP methyl ester carboxylesterase
LTVTLNRPLRVDLPLSLAYAERYPERVSGMLMGSVTSSRRLELDWLYRGVGRFFPEAWARFRDFAGLTDSYLLPTDSRPTISGLLRAYSQMMEDPDLEVRSRADLIIIEDSGHTGSATMTDQMHAAADRLYEHITNPG